MINLTGILSELDKVKNLPWKGLLVAASVGFLCATVATVVCNHLIFPDTEKALRAAGQKRHSGGDIGKEKLSLDKADYQLIIGRNIFNKEGKTGEEEEVTEEAEEEKYTGSDAVKTSLPLKLMGTIFGGDPFSGIALIQDSSKNSLNSFFVGDMLQADAKVIEIHREKIIIQRGERREYLELEKKELATGRRVRKQKSGPVQKVPAYATDAPPESYKEEGFERAGSNIVMSSDFRQKLLTVDFAKILQDAKAEPHLVNGELSGFKLTRIRQDSIYQKSGLQNGGAVKEINGVSLIDTAQAIKLLNSLRGENELEVRLERSGSIQTINLQIR